MNDLFCRADPRIGLLLIEFAGCPESINQKNEDFELPLSGADLSPIQ